MKDTLQLCPVALNTLCGSLGKITALFIYTTAKPTVRYSSAPDPDQPWSNDNSTIAFVKIIYEHYVSTT